MEAITLETLRSIVHGVPVEADANDILVVAKAFRAEHCQVTDITVEHVGVQISEFVTCIELVLNVADQLLIAKVIVVRVYVTSTLSNNGTNEDVARDWILNSFSVQN